MTDPTIYGDLLEQEAEALVGLFNEATPDYAPELEWFGMGHDRDGDRQLFVLLANSYMATEGLDALREAGREIQYIEAYEYDGEVNVTIEVPVNGEVP